MEAVWQRVKNALKNQMPGHSYRMWIEPVVFVGCRDQQVTLSCPNRFCKKRLLEHYAESIQLQFRAFAETSVKLTFEISNGNGGDRVPTETQLPLPDMNVRLQNGRLLRRDFTFDQFVVGGNNDFAYSAALSLASKNTDTAPALYLLGQTGMGKSHLSQAIGHHILAQNPGEQVYYITAEDFTNEMIQSLRRNNIDQFKERYRERCNVLLLEDVQFLSGKERTQLELSMTLESLSNAGKKIILSSCCPPGEIPKLSEKLRSHLASGVVSTIERPDYRTRVRILERKTALNGFELPEEVVAYLAGELTENVRQLQSGLIGVMAKASLLGVPVNVGLAESVVQNISRQNYAVTIEAIKKLVCKYYHISGKDLISRSRKQAIVRPRQIAIYLSRKYTDQPLQAIGRNFNRYHATVLHAVKTVSQDIKQNGPLQKPVEFLCHKLESGRF